MTKTETLANLAGYFDGEGCVSFTSRSLSVQIKSADRENLQRFYDLFGGHFNFCKSDGDRQLYSWFLTSSKAQQFLIEVLPFLATKRDVALLALKPTFGKSGVKLTNEEKQLRDLVAENIHSINQRVTAWM